jgi:hypothetical protein
MARFCPLGGADFLCLLTDSFGAISTPETLAPRADWPGRVGKIASQIVAAWARRARDFAHAKTPSARLCPPYGITDVAALLRFWRDFRAGNARAACSA